MLLKLKSNVLFNKQEFQQQHERLSSNSDATLQTLRLECERVQGELQQLQSDKEAVESDLHEQVLC